MKLKKSIFVPLIFLFLFLTGGANVAFSQKTLPEQSDPDSSVPVEIIPPPPQPDTSSVFGQNYYYTVLFRGNGEAVVYVKTIFSNTQSIPLSQLQFNLPKISINDLAVFQIKREKQCIRYGSEKPIVVSPPINPTPVCIQYQEPDYYSYWGGTTQYRKAEFLVNGSTLTISLPMPLETNQSGSILLSYRTFNYANKTVFGAYEYSFETLKIDDKINTLQIGITTDSDMVLSGTKGETNYRLDEGVAKTLVAPAFEGGINNSQLDSLYNQIGYGTIVKSSSGLKPLESYTAKGSFADSAWKLYAKEATKGFVIVITFLFILVVIMRFIWMKLTKRNDSLAQYKGAVFASLGISFASSLFIALYTGVIFVLANYLGSFLNYYPSYGGFSIIHIFLTVISFGIYAFFLFIPAIGIGIKKGFFWGILTFGSTICWLVLYLIITLIILVFAFYDNTSPNPPYPMPFKGAGLNSIERSLKPVSE